jgi:putative peptidoglycan lipid II flippase
MASTTPKSHNQLITATIIVASFGLLSRASGFIRELLLAKSFGIGSELDIYYTAFRIPDIIYNLLILGTLGAAFIPVFVASYNKNIDAANQLAADVLTTATVIMAAITGIAILAARPLTTWLVPGFSGAQLETTITLTRILLLSPILFTISSVITSYMQSLNRFVMGSLAPILYNLGIIGGLLWLYPHFGLRGLAYGVIIGAGLHVLVQVPSAWKAGLRASIMVNLTSPELRKIGKLFLPRIIGLDISYVSLLIASFVGSLLPVGSIAAFNLANNIQTLPLGVFAVSIATTMFPGLASSYGDGDDSRFLELLKVNLIRVWFWIIPATVGMLLLRAHIVRLAYGYGKFDWAGTIMTFTVLGVLTLGLLSQATSTVLARAFYARQNTITPVIIGLITIGINAVGSYALARALGVTGIAAGFVIASWCNMILLMSSLRHALLKPITNTGASNLLQYLHSFDAGLISATTKIVIASTGLGLATYSALYAASTVVNTHTIAGIATQTVIATTAGAVTYFLIAVNLGIAPAQHMWQSLKARISRNHQKA